MKAKLSAGVKALANGAGNEDSAPVLRGVHVTKKEAVVADGWMLVIKQLQPQEMQLEPIADDGIEEVTIPADAIKACKGEELNLQTIEAMKEIPSAELMGKDAKVTTTKIVARMDGADFSVEADAIEGKYPNYEGLFPTSLFIGQFAVNTKLLKKMLRTLPDNEMLQFRVSEPDKPIEFQCIDVDGDLPIRGMFMPMGCSWEHTVWKSKDGTSQEK